MTTEKYPYQASQLSTEEKLDMVQKGLWGTIARIVRAVHEKYGEEGLETISNALRNWEAHRHLVGKFGVPLGEASLKDLLLKFYDPIADIYFTTEQKRTVTREPDENRLHIVYLECNVAKAIAREFPRTCAFVCRPMDKAQAEVANPNIRVSGDKYISQGDDGCHIYLEMTNPDAQERLIFNLEKG